MFGFYSVCIQGNLYVCITLISDKTYFHKIFFRGKNIGRLIQQYTFLPNPFYVSKICNSFILINF